MTRSVSPVIGREDTPKPSTKALKFSLVTRVTWWPFLIKASASAINGWTSPRDPVVMMAYFMICSYEDTHSAGGCALGERLWLDLGQPRRIAHLLFDPVGIAR